MFLFHRQNVMPHHRAQEGVHAMPHLGTYGIYAMPRHGAQGVHAYHTGKQVMYYNACHLSSHLLIYLPCYGANCAKIRIIIIIDFSIAMYFSSYSFKCLASRYVFLFHPVTSLDSFPLAYCTCWNFLLHFSIFSSIFLYNNRGWCRQWAPCRALQRSTDKYRWVWCRQWGPSKGR